MGLNDYEINISLTSADCVTYSVVNICSDIETRSNYTSTATEPQLTFTVNLSTKVKLNRNIINT